MKKTKISFLAGVATTLLLGTGTITALASNDIIKIDASPISVLVNGEVFSPKDANGNDALVFTYNGTTYAPLRALAEAYGLTVGYDNAKKIATVNDDNHVDTQYDEKSVEYFKSLWRDIEIVPDSGNSSDRTVIVNYSGDMAMSEFKTWWKSLDENVIEEAGKEIGLELISTLPNENFTLYFKYNSYALGKVTVYDQFPRANFSAANAWI